jgi:hypothetical protein
VSIKIYQTDDMEASIHQMVKRNDLAIVFRRRWCKRHIPLKQDLICQIPSITLIPVGEGCTPTVNMWRYRRCLMWYDWREWPDWRPRGEAMLFLEIPLWYSFFEWICRQITREIIVYRPPSWDMQEEMIGIKTPGAAECRAVEAIGRTLNFKPRNTREQAAMTLSEYPPETTNLFTREEICALSGLAPIAARKLLNKAFRFNHTWYQPVRLNAWPDEEHLVEAYERLDSFDDMGEGMRLIKSGLHGVHPASFSKLIQAGAITYYQPIHLVKEGGKRLDFTKVEAEANAKLSDWYKMRKLIEDADEY